jgi:hypothetical protein
MYKAANAPIIQPSNYSNVLLPGQPRLTALNRAQPRSTALICGKIHCEKAGYFSNLFLSFYISRC